MKKLREGGEGTFEFIMLDTEGKTVEGLLQDVYEASGWAPATDEEYTAALHPESSDVPVEEAPAEAPAPEAAPAE